MDIENWRQSAEGGGIKWEIHSAYPPLEFGPAYICPKFRALNCIPIYLRKCWQINNGLSPTSSLFRNITKLCSSRRNNGLIWPENDTFWMSRLWKTNAFSPASVRHSSCCYLWIYINCTSPMYKTDVGLWNELVKLSLFHLRKGKI